MDFYVMTLFPELIETCTGASILGRGVKNKAISVTALNIRDYTLEKHGQCDDYPYGGGVGMVMQVEPIWRCFREVQRRREEAGRSGRPLVIYLSPKGKLFHQHMAEELSKEEDLVFLCGHYEGVDERALGLLGAEEVSVGDYVLTGGELPAVLMIDCISRLIPGVLGKAESAEEESISSGLLEYPQYTRPEVYEGLRVPEVLLSGHHGKVEEWRRLQSLLLTRERRPDLYACIELSKSDRKLLKKYEEARDQGG